MLVGPRWIHFQELMVSSSRVKNRDIQLTKSTYGHNDRYLVQIML